MKAIEDVWALEKLITQLAGLHAEITQLVKKSSNDRLNKFKLSLVNKVPIDVNQILIWEYVTLDDFQQFDANDLPKNSDGAILLSQYIN